MLSLNRAEETKSYSTLICTRSAAAFRQPITHSPFPPFRASRLQATGLGHFVLGRTCAFHFSEGKLLETPFPISYFIDLCCSAA